MYKNARPPRSVSPRLAQSGERGHKEQPPRQTKFTKKQWKTKQEKEILWSKKSSKQGDAKDSEAYHVTHVDGVERGKRNPS
jgi:hypothetical protein